MILQFLRLGAGIELSKDSVSVMEIQSPGLYARVCQSLLSGEGEQAVEPYCLWDDDGGKANPKKSLLVLNSLPDLPYDSRPLLTKLFGHVARELETSPDVLEEVSANGNRIIAAIEDSLGGLAGEYAFTIDWSIEAFLKAFGFTLAHAEGESFVDSCIKFLGMCIDIGLDMSVVMIGGKSFFELCELQQLYDSSVFLGVSLLFVERYHDENTFNHEQKTIVDQDFLVY